MKLRTGLKFPKRWPVFWVRSEIPVPGSLTPEADGKSFSALPARSIWHSHFIRFSSKGTSGPPCKIHVQDQGVSQPIERQVPPGFVKPSQNEPLSFYVLLEDEKQNTTAVTLGLSIAGSRFPLPIEHNSIALLKDIPIVAK